MENVDYAVIARLDLESFTHDIVIKSMKENRAFFNKYYALPPEKRRRFVKNWLANEYGISSIPDNALEKSLIVPSRGDDD